MGDWTEKYRPATLDDVVGNDTAKNELRKWAESWNKGLPKNRAVVLSGKPGIGKTSCAIALANNYGWTTIELNTSDARNATKIKNVATIGSLNETFSDDGSFISSNSGGRKLIILDEADNLYERAEAINESQNDFSDKGGKKAIIDTIKTTKQPIILIVNDYYNLIKGGGEILKDLCKHIKFYDPYNSSIITLLKKISLKEGVNVDQKALQTIADRCKGDVRSAINDLQALCLDRTQVDVKSLDVLGYRDREKDIFNALRDIFKTKNIKSIKESISHLDLDPGLVILWINENLPREYIDYNDLQKGYDLLSKADIFLGRTQKNKDYSLWSYACDFMNGGVAVSKTHAYPNNNYSFPLWLSEKKRFKNVTEIRNSIIEKLGKASHSSSIKCNDYFLNHFALMFNNDTNFAIKMKNKLNLSEMEIKFLLGEKHKNKFDQIMAGLDSKEPEIKKELNEIENKKEEKEDYQQTLLDF